MRSNPTGFTLLELLMIAGLLALAIFFGALRPYFEMRSFNKFSKVPATYWDAVFSELRVEAVK